MVVGEINHATVRLEFHAVESPPQATTIFQPQRPTRLVGLSVAECGLAHRLFLFPGVVTGSFHR